MDRRALLKFGSTTFLASPPVFGLSSQNARGQVVEALAIAIALAPYFEGTCALIQTFHSEDTETFKRIEAGIGRLNKAISTLVVEMRRWRDDFERVLARQQLGATLLEITSAEDSIIDEVRAIQSGGSLQNSNLQRFAGDQHKNRNSLIKGGYGPSVYPYIARAFVSQALALCTLGNSRELFQQCQNSTAKALGDDANAFLDFAKKPNSEFHKSTQEWKRNAGPTYLGSSCGFVKCDAYYITFPETDYGSTTKPRMRMVENSHKWNEWNPRGWRESDYLDYKDNGTYDEEDMYDRRSLIARRMRKSAKNGLRSKGTSDNYATLASSALKLAKVVKEMRYPQSDPAIAAEKG